MPKNWNKVPFSHHGRYGCELKAKRADFVGGVDLTVPASLPLPALASDITEIMTYHAMNIHQNLNGFAGYDGVTFRITFEKD